MTPDDRTLETAMAGLATHAPTTLAPDVLVEVGNIAGLIGALRLAD